VKRLIGPISLKGKLLVMMIGLFLFFIWALAWISTTVLKDRLEQVLSDQQVVFTRRLATDLDNKLTERVQSLSGIAKDIPTDLQARELDSYLPRLKALHTMFPAGIAVIGLDGKVIADYPAASGRRGSYFGDYDYFHKAVQTKRYYIGKPIIAPESKSAALIIAVPVMDGRGNVRAVISGITDLTSPNFLGVVSDPAMTGEGRSFVVSPHDNLIVTSSDANKTLDVLPKRGTNLLYDRIVDGFEGSGIAADALGEPRIFSAARIPVANWIAIASLPTEIAFSPVRAMQDYLFMVAGGMTLLAFILILWMTRHLLHPLVSAGSAMRQMTQGEAPLAPLPILRMDEIGELIGNFNSLILDRQRYEAALADSEQRFRLLVEGAPDAIFLQVEGDFAYVNEAAISLFGAKTREELLGMPVSSRIHADFRRVAEERMGLINKSRKAAPPLEKKYLRMDGTVVDVEVSAVPFRYENADGSLVFVRNITARTRIEHQLRKSEASLINAQRIAHVGSWEKDMKTGEIFWSDELYRICGAVPQQVKPNLYTILERLHPDDRPVFREAASNAVTKGIPYRLDFRFVLSDGSERAVHADAEPVFDADGEVIRVTGTMQDITEKKVAERLLRKREEEFRALVENSPDLIFRFELECRCVYANPAAIHATGLRSDQISSDAIEGLALPGVLGETWLAAIKTVIVTKEPTTFEFSLRTPMLARYYQVRMVPEFGMDGRVQNVLAIARDISAIKGGEVVLRESEQRLHGITANTPGMVFQCQLRARDSALMFTFVSEGSSLLLGLKPGEILSNRNAIAERLVQPDRDAFFDNLSYSALTMEIWHWEGRMISADGQEKWINCRATPRPALDGDVIWEGVMLNISDSKHSEDELRASRQMLRELSAHRERVREEERKRIAREVHDELGQSLTALRMDVSLLRLNFGAQNTQLMERIQSMTRAVDGTIKIVRHVTTALRPVALDLGLIASLEWLVEQFSEHNGINCMLENNGCDEVTLDDDRATALFRMVQESLTNVAKHAEASKVRITIAPEDESNLCVQIHDDGKGFEQGTARKVGSFGLIGMRERALMLQGTLDIQSDPGAGTRIEICIPMFVQ